MDKDLAQALRDIQKSQLQHSMTALTHQEHMKALEETLFYLDNRARGFFEKQLEIQRSKNRRRHEELQQLSLIIDATLPERPN